MGQPTTTTRPVLQPLDTKDWTKGLVASPPEPPHPMLMSTQITTPQGYTYSSMIRGALPPVLDNSQLQIFRVHRCSRLKMGGGVCHFGDRCQFSHDPTWRRRPPLFPRCNKLRYVSLLCPKVQMKQGTILRSDCEAGEDCLFAHSMEEIMYHPEFYKTRLCPDLFPEGNLSGRTEAPRGCARYYCAFAHTLQELRDRPQYEQPDGFDMALMIDTIVKRLNTDMITGSPAALPNASQGLLDHMRQLCEAGTPGAAAIGGARGVPPTPARTDHTSPAVSSHSPSSMAPKHILARQGTAAAGGGAGISPLSQQGVAAALLAAQQQAGADAAAAAPAAYRAATMPVGAHQLAVVGGNGEEHKSISSDEYEEDDLLKLLGKQTSRQRFSKGSTVPVIPSAAMSFASVASSTPAPTPKNGGQPPPLPQQQPQQLLVAQLPQQQQQQQPHGQLHAPLSAPPPPPAGQIVGPSLTPYERTSPSSTHQPPPPPPPPPPGSEEGGKELQSFWTIEEASQLPENLEPLEPVESTDEHKEGGQQQEDQQQQQEGELPDIGQIREWLMSYANRNPAVTQLLASAGLGGERDIPTPAYAAPAVPSPRSVPHPFPPSSARSDPDPHSPTLLNGDHTRTGSGTQTSRQRFSKGSTVPVIPSAAMSFASVASSTPAPTPKNGGQPPPLPQQQPQQLLVAQLPQQQQQQQPHGQLHAPLSAPPPPPAGQIVGPSLTPYERTSPSSTHQPPPPPPPPPPGSEEGGKELQSFWTIEEASQLPENLEPLEPVESTDEHKEGGQQQEDQQQQQEGELPDIGQIREWLMSYANRNPAVTQLLASAGLGGERDIPTPAYAAPAVPSPRSVPHPFPPSSARSDPDPHSPTLLNGDHTRTGSGTVTGQSLPAASQSVTSESPELLYKSRHYEENVHGIPPLGEEREDSPCGSKTSHES
ncbi:unnamed protein product [Vitrella brassicaformis CCMP3155]|uniref:C3H1-type domain-containing protein n=1 Tax=Vitrella brassicaformis (strain CCMP3155) TaxID=1169540 RepID=A0A0G4H0G4_VITBC|nr:unnamed protein product [Vitrella brassicaformis CCMP3155]|eukprot:CEM36818.1 unnamed protein product [Vitrella brassicaformis CCMP3155]